MPYCTSRTKDRDAHLLVTVTGSTWYTAGVVPMLYWVSGEQGFPHQYKENKQGSQVCFVTTALWTKTQ